jgi:molecular chaperone DnaK
MVKEAQANAATDSNRREKIEAHNEGDNSAYQAEKMLRENGDKIPAAAKSEIEAKIAAVRQAIGGEDVALMRSATEDLRNTLANAGAAMYQADDNATPAGDAPKPPTNDDVIDGEVRDDK